MVSCSVTFLLSSDAASSHTGSTERYRLIEQVTRSGKKRLQHVCIGVDW